jgi:hypothetical protein
MVAETDTVHPPLRKGATMPKFEVTILRTFQLSTTVTVAATDEEAAEAQALALVEHLPVRGHVDGKYTWEDDGWNDEVDNVDYAWDDATNVETR